MNARQRAVRLQHLMLPHARAVWRQQIESYVERAFGREIQDDGNGEIGAGIGMNMSRRRAKNGPGVSVTVPADTARC